MSETFRQKFHKIIPLQQNERRCNFQLVTRDQNLWTRPFDIFLEKFANATCFKMNLSKFFYYFEVRDLHSEVKSHYCSLLFKYKSCLKQDYYTYDEETRDCYQPAKRDVSYFHTEYLPWSYS